MQRETAQLTPAELVWLTAERSVLGSVWLAPDWLAKAATVLAARDFRDPTHAAVWSAMAEWWAAVSADAGDSSDLAAMDLHAAVRQSLAPDTATLDRAERLLPLYVGDHACGLQASFLAAVHTVADMAAQERYRQTVDRLQAQLKAEIDPEVRAAIANEIAGVPLPSGRETTANPTLHPSDALSAVLDGKAASEWVCPTGLRVLDSRHGGGLHPGRLYVVAGRPGWGKSALALQVTAAAAGGGHGVAFASLEMAQDDVSLRLGAILSGVHLMDRDLTAHPLSGWERSAVETARAEITGWNLHVRCQPTSAAQFVDWATSLKRSHGVRVVVLDYIGLVTGKPRQSAWERIGEASVACKQLALHGVAVVVCAQLNREAENHARPRADHLSGADQIAMDADAVIIPWRPRNADSYPHGYAELLTVKGRRCRVGRDRIQWVGATQSFADSQDDYVEPLHEEQQDAKKGDRW